MPLSQNNRPLKVTTPLGKDAFVLTNFSAREGLSQLFQYYLEMVASNDTEVKFEQLLGQNVTVEIAVQKQSRFFNGIVSRVSQGTRDGTVTIYRAEVVPQLWLLTRKWQSRIFQHMNVPDILNKVLTDIDRSLEITGTFEPRDYCVQYRETDFHFASRLMEEEGIFYFFTHAEGEHTLVVADNPSAHPPLPFDPDVTYEPLEDDTVAEDRVVEWEKAQDLRSMKFTLWDHCFELPGQNLQAQTMITGSVQAGTVSHKLLLGSPDRLEIYDWPGEYAQRFDGVSPDLAGKPDAAMSDATLRTATLIFEDRSLLSKVVPAAAKLQGTDVDTVTKLAKTMLDGMRAGQTETTLAVLDTLSSYLDDYKHPKGPLKITVNPPNKASAAALSDIKSPNDAVKALGLVVTYGG